MSYASIATAAYRQTIRKAAKKKCIDALEDFHYASLAEGMMQESLGDAITTEPRKVRKIKTKAKASLLKACFIKEQ